MWMDAFVPSSLVSLDVRVVCDLLCAFIFLSLKEGGGGFAVCCGRVGHACVGEC